MTDEFKTLIDKSIKDIENILESFSRLETDDIDTNRRVSFSIRVLTACMKQLMLFGDVKKENR